MAFIDISARLLNDKKIIALLQDLSDEGVNKAIKSGVSSAARGAKKHIVGGLKTGGLNLKSGRIKAGLNEPKFQAGGMSAVVYASSDPVTATSYGAKQNSKGLGVTFYKGERKTIKGGFYAKGMPLARVPGKRWPDKFSTRFIHGPSISKAYTSGAKSGVIKPYTEKEVAEALAKGIKRRLDSFARNF